MQADVFVTVGNRAITPTDIRDCIVFENVFSKLPTLNLVYSDINGNCIRNPFKDREVIGVFMSTGNGASPIVQMSFELANWTFQETRTEKESTFMVFVSAAMLVDHSFDAESGKSYQGNSSDVAKTIAQELGLSPDVRVSSVDQMNWIRTKGTNRMTFLKHLEERAYIDKGDFPFIRIDRNKKLVYSSYLNEIKKDPKLAFYKTASEISATVENGISTIPVSSWKQISLAGSANRKFGYGVKHEFYTDMENLEDDIMFNDATSAGVTYPQKDPTLNKVRVNAFNFGHQSVNVHDAFYSTMVQNAYCKYNYLNTFLEVGLMGKNLIDKTPELLQIGTLVNFVDMFDDTTMNLYVSGKYFVFSLAFAFNNADIETTVVLARGGNNILKGNKT